MVGLEFASGRRIVDASNEVVGSFVSSRDKESGGELTAVIVVLSVLVEVVTVVGTGVVVVVVVV